MNWKRKVSPATLWQSGVCLIGVLIALYGMQLWHWRDQQVELYNSGLSAYKQKQYQQAVELFDKSFDAYQAPSSLWGAPNPDQQLAAQAAFQKAKALIALKQNAAAVDAYKNSLRLNSGNGAETGQFTDELSGAALQALNDGAYFCVYDYELALKNDPSQAQAQGKQGKGKGQKGRKGKGKQPGEGEQPGDDAQKGEPKQMPGQQQKSGQPGAPGKGPKSTI